MSDREVQFIALHGKNAPIAFGQSLYRSAEMYGTGSGSQVVHHIPGGHDAQTGIQINGSLKDGFVEGFVLTAVTAAHLQKIIPETVRCNQSFDALHRTGIKIGRAHV